MNQSRRLRMTVYAALLAALTAVGAFIALPIGPVPIVLQNMFVLLAGILLGPRWGTAAVALYLLAGAVGLPVFAGGAGGLARFAGPTGGYLVSYLPAAALVGLIASPRRPLTDAVAALAGVLVVYCFGVPWLKFLTGMSWGKSLAVGMYPFIIGDLLKAAACVPIARAIRPIMERYGDDA